MGKDKGFINNDLYEKYLYHLKRTNLITYPKVYDYVSDSVDDIFYHEGKELKYKKLIKTEEVEIKNEPYNYIECDTLLDLCYREISIDFLNKTNYEICKNKNCLKMFIPRVSTQKYCSICKASPWLYQNAYRDSNRVKYREKQKKIMQKKRMKEKKNTSNEK